MISICTLLQVQVPNSEEYKIFTFPPAYTVDKVKVGARSALEFLEKRCLVERRRINYNICVQFLQSEIFRQLPSLNESMKFDYYLGLSEEVSPYIP